MDRLPKKNLTAKIVALILAIILWVYVMNEQNPPVEVNMEIPLEVRNLSSNLVPVDNPDYVRIRVRGPRTLIAGIGKQDIKTYIDLKGLTEGVNTTKVHTTIPTGMEVVEVAPDKVTLHLESLVSRQVPVEVKLKGAPPADSIVDKVTYSSHKVAVEGPKGLLDTAVKAVAYVDVAGKNTDFTLSVPLKILDQNGKEVEEGLQIRPNSMYVSLFFVSSTTKKTVDIKPNITGQLVKGVTLKQILTNPQKIEISGDRQIIDKIDALYTEPISLNGIDKDVELDGKLQVRDGVTISSKNVKVSISVIKQQ
ncbi:MAG: YbbR family protein [Pelosinus sp.]|jgi:YbbR domain-containing protein|nr:YbbR family protein [Pelosinus sp.]